MLKNVVRNRAKTNINFFHTWKAISKVVAMKVYLWQRQMSLILISMYVEMLFLPRRKKNFFFLKESITLSFQMSLFGLSFTDDKPSVE